MLKKRKLLLGSIVVGVLALGWRYPLFGLVVPVVVMTGLTVSAFRGRYFCGNWCPRGAFLDSLPIAQGKWQALPRLLQSPYFRWTAVVVLFSVMIGRGLQNPGSILHWGMVFWQMCLATTAVALLLAVIYRPRAWCAMCPVGTVQRALGRGRKPLTIGSQCTGCGLCERACPLALPITNSRAAGVIESADCLKCGRCRAACPIGAIGRPAASKNKLA
mgnify:CR=1 FL=1